MDRYIVISADCHAGADHNTYRSYLESRWLEDFDAWRRAYRNPFRDLQDDRRTRNWDNERRIRELDADGVVAEVVFPNTVPPFFPTGQVMAPAPSTEDFERRLAGLRAHNRWLSDFVGRYPHRRAGLAEVFLNDVDEAVRDARWAKTHGLTGILVPGVSPDTPWIEPLFSPVYEPLWAVCEELGLVIAHHAGSGIPRYPVHPATTGVFVIETTFYANRGLCHLILAGVFARHPNLKLVMTEQGCQWVPEVLTEMDFFHEQTLAGRIGEIGVPAEAVLPMRPSEYFARNCYIAASFPCPSDARLLAALGPDRVMWGADYPHHEGTTPHSREALRHSFSGWSEADLRMILAGTAAEVYGFDLDALAPIAAQHGPTVEELGTPLDAIPGGATSQAFTRRWFLDGGPLENDPPRRGRTR